MACGACALFSTTLLAQTTPIVVEGRLWGAMVAASTHDERLPADTELRIGQFTELMATAIAWEMRKHAKTKVVTTDYQQPDYEGTGL